MNYKFRPSFGKSLKLLRQADKEKAVDICKDFMSLERKRDVDQLIKVYIGNLVRMFRMCIFSFDVID